MQLHIYDCETYKCRIYSLDLVTCKNVRVKIWYLGIYNQDKLVHDGLKIDEDLPNSYADNFSRDKIKNNNSTCLWSRMDGWIIFMQHHIFNFSGGGRGANILKMWKEENESLPKWQNSQINLIIIYRIRARRQVSENTRKV